MSADTRAAWRLSVPLIVPIAIRVIPGPVRILSYAWATGYALFGRRQAIIALALLWFCNMFTHAFGLPPGNAAIFRHSTLFAACFSVFILHAGAPPRSRTPLLLAWTAVMSLLVVVHSLVLSTMPDISVLKAISFALTIQVLLTGWSRLSPRERSVTEKQFWGLFYALTVLSIPLAFTGAGYFKIERAFQGLLEHPQAFGPIMGIVAVWLFGTWLTDRRMSLILKVVLAVSLSWVYLAGARIGAVVFLAGATTTIAAGPLTGFLNRSTRVPRVLKRRLTAAVVGLAVLSIVLGPVISERVEKFIAKQTESTSIFDAAWQSRGFLVEAMQENIRQRPLTGIGFGVASSPEAFSGIVRDPIFGLAVMATIEKGVMPVAIVEELGWPLALLYAPWFLGLLVMSIRAGPRYAGVCAAALAVNLGEAVFFSPGGGGLIVQSFVAMAATAAPAREDPSVAPLRGV